MGMKVTTKKAAKYGDWTMVSKLSDNGVASVLYCQVALPGSAKNKNFAESD